MKFSSLHRQFRLVLLLLISSAVAGLPARSLAARPGGFFVTETANDLCAPDEENPGNDVSDESNEAGSAADPGDEGDGSDDVSGDDGTVAGDGDGWTDEEPCGGDDSDDHGADTDLEDPNVIFYTFGSSGEVFKDRGFSIFRPQTKLAANKSRLSLKGTGGSVKTVYWKIVGRDRSFHSGTVRSDKWTAVVTNLRHGKNRVVVFGVTASGAKTKRVTLTITRK